MLNRKLKLQTIICMKWGTRYGPDFVNRLYSAIKRHTKKPTKFYCFTDDNNGINKDVLCRQLPKIQLPEKISLLHGES